MFFGGGRGGFDPFEGMGGGGMPGRKRGPIDNEKFYKLLEVEKTASEPEIKKAYRKMAIKHHPDKGGDPETFKNITQAYEVLSDPDKRRRYDEGGEEAVSGDGGGGDPQDVFDMFFGGGGGGRRGGGGRQRRKTKDVVHQLPVSLEQVYNGATKKMAVSRQVIDKKAGVKSCQSCDGRGVQVQVIRMGPMIQQVQQPCAECEGQGKTYQTKREKEVLEVYIDKGSPDGHKVVFSGKADEHPDADPGDVVFVLRVQEHATFTRKGADLYVKRDISLSEALCGYTLQLEHLDGRTLLVKNQPGAICTPMLKNPLSAETAEVDFDTFADTDSPGEIVAQAETQDVATCKKVCEKKGFQGFILDGSGIAKFKQASRAEILAAKKPKSGATLYVMKDPNESAPDRLCKAVKGEGMPTHKNPFVCGNLFLLLNIVFPAELDEKAVALLQKALPAKPLNVPSCAETDNNVEVHMVKDMDPVQSYKEGTAGMGKNAHDEDDEEEGRMPGGQRVQCQQQ